MRAEPLNIDWEERLRAYHRERSRGRSAGRHLSEIVHRIVEQITPGRYGSGPIDPTMAHGGFVWEDVLSEVLGKHLGLHQIEVECDGIIGTLDGHEAIGDGIVIEAKDSKMSAGNPITSKKFDPWMIRTLGYCKMVDTLQAKLVVRFANGSYELGGGRFGKPVMKGWLLTWTKLEQEDNWRRIRRMRDQMDREDRRAARDREDARMLGRKSRSRGSRR